VSVTAAVKFALEQGVDSSRISLSSDGNASLPVFDHAGECIGVEVGQVSSLFHAMLALVKSGFSLEQILPLVTSNAARTLKLKRKGGIALDKDADFVLLNNDLAINKVWGKGQLLVDNGIAVKLGTFEVC